MHTENKENLRQLSIKVRQNDVQGAKEFLNNNGAEYINMLTGYGRTVLIDAVLNDNLEMVELLLSNGANPDVQDIHYGCTPLHIAADRKNNTKYFYPDRERIKNTNKIIKALFSHGASVDIPTLDIGELINNGKKDSSFEGFKSLITNDENLFTLTSTHQFTKNNLVQLSPQMKLDLFLEAIYVVKDQTNIEKDIDNTDLSLLDMPPEILTKIGTFVFTDTTQEITCTGLSHHPDNPQCLIM